MPAEVVRDLCTSYVSEEDCRRLILSHLLQEDDAHGSHSKDHLRECAQNARIKALLADVPFPAPRATTVDMALGLDKISDEPERPRNNVKLKVTEPVLILNMHHRVVKWPERSTLPVRSSVAEEWRAYTYTLPSKS